MNCLYNDVSSFLNLRFTIHRIGPLQYGCLLYFFFKLILLLFLSLLYFFFGPTSLRLELHKVGVNLSRLMVAFGNHQPSQRTDLVGPESFPDVRSWRKHQPGVGRAAGLISAALHQPAGFVGHQSSALTGCFKHRIRIQSSFQNYSLKPFLWFVSNAKSIDACPSGELRRVDDGPVIRPPAN